MIDDFNAVISRRSFLKGAAFAAVSTGIATRSGVASQERGQDGAHQSKPTPDTDASDSSAPDQPDDTSNAAKRSPEGEQKPSTVVLKDDQGIEYRECPQCGFNMYRQDRTWTCENCGYSYIE